MPTHKLEQWFYLLVLKTNVVELSYNYKAEMQTVLILQVLLMMLLRHIFDYLILEIWKLRLK